MAGASAAFWIGRTLGREFAASLIGDRLKKYDDAIEKNGFATVLYLRLVYFPFTPMNFGMGLTKVRFWDYFFGRHWESRNVPFLCRQPKGSWPAAMDCSRLVFSVGLLSSPLYSKNHKEGQEIKLRGNLLWQVTILISVS
jgi:hypothetical protein